MLFEKNEYINVYDKYGRSLGATNKWQIVPDSYDYIIFKEGDYVIAKNGRTGTEEIERDNIGDVLEYVVERLKDGGRIFIAPGEYMVPVRYTIQHTNGTYYIGILLNQANNIHIEGAGIGSTVIKAGKGVNILMYNYASSNFAIGNLTLDGNKDVQTWSYIDGAGLYLSGGPRENNIYYNLELRNSKAHSMYLGYNNIINGELGPGWEKNSILTNLIVHDNSGGIELDNVENVILSNSVFVNNSSNIQNTGAGNHNVLAVVDNVTIENPSTTAVWATGSGKLIVKNSYIYVNGDTSSSTLLLQNDYTELDNVKVYRENATTSVPLALIQTNAMIRNSRFEMYGSRSGLMIGVYFGTNTIAEAHNSQFIGKNTLLTMRIVYITNNAQVKFYNCYIYSNADTFVNEQTNTSVEGAQVEVYNSIIGERVVHFGGAGTTTRTIKFVNTKITRLAGSSNVEQIIDTPKNVKTFENLTNIKFYENYGIATFTGDGTTTTFQIAHSLVSTPSTYLIQPLTADAMSIPYDVTVDNTYITITFTSAPASGTTLKFYWYAEV